MINGRCASLNPGLHRGPALRTPAPGDWLTFVRSKPQNQHHRREKHDRAKRQAMMKLSIFIFMLVCSATASVAAAQTGTLKGRIEGDKGKPIAGAEVRAMRSRERSVKETRTDGAGNYSFQLEPDDYTVSFDAEGYQGGTLVQMQQVEEGRETEVKTIRLEKVKHRTSLIRGAVFNSNGASLAGVSLKLIRVPTPDEEKEHKRGGSFSLSYVTNSHGEFAFRVPAGRARYKVTATLFGYTAATKVVDVNEYESVPLAFSLEAAKK
jgi:hypothetical protein